MPTSRTSYPAWWAVFSENQSDEATHCSSQRRAFGTALSGEDFRKVMASVRGVNIDTSSDVDLSTKNNLDLAQWAIAAEKAGWGYVWGTYGQVLDQALYAYKLEQYPEEVGGYAEFIEQHWLGRRCADCIGLIKGYGWFDPENGAISYGSNGMPDMDANSMYELAVKKGPMDTMPEIPRPGGLAPGSYWDLHRMLKEAVTFVLPPRSDTMRRVYGYLLHHRGIDREVLDAFAQRGMVYESSDYHNAVFVGVDPQGQPRHAHKRGTGSESTYKGNVPGSQPEYCFHWMGTGTRP
ncbi:MAG: DUF3991 domain-containing protein [Oscillospiraceae bacterium]